MYITCLDLEGVLVPEIWIAFAEASGIPELKRTTRDEPDYDKLMRWRIGILKEHGLGLKEIQETIERMRDEVTNKIDWTKAWSKKYPILESYQKEVNITYYAEALCKLLIRLEKEYGYDELNSMLVLKDILATVWKKRSEKKS